MTASNGTWSAHLSGPAIEDTWIRLSVGGCDRSRRSRLRELPAPLRHEWDRQTGVFGALLGRVAPLG